MGGLGYLTDTSFDSMKGQVDDPRNVEQQETYSSQGISFIASVVLGWGTEVAISSAAKGLVKFIQPGKDRFSGDGDLIPPHILTSRAELKDFLKNNNIPLKDGWDADKLYDEVLSIQKPNRQTPDKYLKPEYIAARLAEFDSGVVRIQARDKLVDGKFTSRYESFAMPYSEWERIKIETGGDPVKIQKNWGFKILLM